MAQDASFIYQFINDFWDLLPQEDRDLIAAYWHGLTLAVADLYNETFETALAVAVEDVGVWRTERWNRYQLLGTTTDIQTATDTIQLTGTVGVALSEDAVLFDSLEVANSTGSIQYTELVTLYDIPADLRYGNIVSGTLRVREGTASFLESKDYFVNLVSGQIKRVDGEGIPYGTVVTITYVHPLYEENIDYTIDQQTRKIARTATSSIYDGDTVSVSFDYDNTDPLMLSGIGIINSTAGTLSDIKKNFTGVQTGRTVTVSSGANVGTYTVKTVLSATVIEINETFVSNDNYAIYSVNAFPYAIGVNEKIASIPTMQDLIVNPTILWRENIDYIVSGGRVSFRETPPITRTNDGPTMWAEETKLDEQTVYRNFGVLIDFYRESSADYLNAVKGLWYAYWTGSTHENLLRGMNIILGLPFATEAATVVSISTTDTFLLDLSALSQIVLSSSRFIYPSSVFTQDDIGRTIRISNSTVGNDGDYTISAIVSGTTVTVAEPFTSDEGPGGFIAELYQTTDTGITLEDEDGIVYSHTIPSGLLSNVEVGDVVERFQRLTTGVRIFDKVNLPGFIDSRLGRHGIQRFLTQDATKGLGNSDETKALTLLEEHVFLAQVLTSAVGESTNTVELITFLQNLKPKWSEFVFTFADDFNETFELSEDFDHEVFLDLTTILRNTWHNYVLEDVEYNGIATISFNAVRALAGTLNIYAQSVLSDSGATFTSSDVGRYIEIGSSGFGNDGDYRIDKILSTSLVQVSPDFVATETPGFTADVKALQKITSAGATFSSTARIHDIIRIVDGNNSGVYKIYEVTDDTNLLVFEDALDAPFAEEEVDVDILHISRSWFMDQGAINMNEHFLHEQDDGATTAASTFQVDSSVNLDVLGVEVGYILVIKSGANMDVYNIASITNKTTFVVAETFPSQPSSGEDYAICQAAIVLKNSGGTVLDAIPI